MNSTHRQRVVRADGRTLNSVNSAWQVRQIFDYIESMLKADRFLKPPAELSEFVFNYGNSDFVVGSNG
jgi:cobaltochelatase CobN